MNPTPTGRVVSTGQGRDLVLERTFRAPIEDVWASLTEPKRTARWLGPWKGDGAPGRTVELTMSAEGDAPAAAVHIEACQPPRHLRVAMDDAAGAWRLEAELTEADGITTLRLTHHLDDSADPASTGARLGVLPGPPGGSARWHGDAGVGRLLPGAEGVLRAGGRDLTGGQGRGGRWARRRPEEPTTRFATPGGGRTPPAAPPRGPPPLSQP
jgi:uncharacterized protein YndB with AHSA1/START domain